VTSLQDETAARLAARKEHLMAETRRPAPAWRRFRTAAAAVAVAALAGTAGGLAANADNPAVTRQDNGVVRIEEAKLTYFYDGRSITRDELTRLQAEGKAGFTVSSPEAACKGLMLAFDTSAEADADFAAYADRARTRPAPNPGNAVCIRYR
jgi:hypothetical protein